MLPPVPTQTRKQREIAERHQLILDAARRLLLERGYVGLSMDRIAAAIEYSKGTIYQHFSCKEEVVFALAIQTAEQRYALFARAATLPGRPRERMMALGVAAELFFERWPDHFLAEQTALAAVREKVSPARQGELHVCQANCMGIASGIVRDAVAAGDLVLPEGRTAEALSFGLWAMSLGAFTFLSCHSGPTDHLGLGADPLEALRRNQHRLLDGYGWRPLTEEWDYDSTRARARALLERGAE